MQQGVIVQWKNVRFARSGFNPPQLQIIADHQFDKKKLFVIRKVEYYTVINYLL